MDLTPQLVNDVDFRTRRGGGYDADEVDDFLERVAVGVGELHDRIRQAQERVAAAEARARDAEAKLAAVPPVEARQETSELDETLKRTLVLAQRTADAAVREAEEHAAQVVAAAEEHSQTLVADAEVNARRLVEDAEAEARRGAEDTRQRLVDEITVLEATRELVKADVAVLERHVDEQRLRVRSAASDLQRLVDDPAGLRLVELPSLSDATILAGGPDAAVESPDEVDEPADAEADADAGPTEDSGPPTEAVTVLADDVDAVDDVWRVDDEQPNDADVPLVEAAGRAGDTDAWTAPAPAVSDDLPEEGRLGLFDGVTTDPAEAMAAQKASIWDTTAPGGAAQGDDDDAYLSELRKAMIDEHDNTAPLTDDDRPSRSRFGRRR